MKALLEREFAQQLGFDSIEELDAELAKRKGGND